MEQVLAALDGSDDLPTNAALLTFDDGYLDHFINVFPILFDEKLQGSFYPPLAPVRERKLLDVNRVHFVLASSPVDEVVDAIRKFVDAWQEREDILTFDQYYSEWAVPNRFDSAAIIFIKRMLQTALPAALREELARNLFSEYVSSDEKSFASELYMDTQQAKMMVDCGMHFGSHGDTHQWLNRLTIDALQREIDNSLLFLKEIGAPYEAGDWTLSYPFGGWSDDVVRVVLYHSYTTLKHLNEDECESYLLIVDDQKINLPTSVISYVTSTAIPKFMKEMDKQCEIYHVNKEKN